MRSFLLFILGILCLSGAAYLGAGALFGKREAAAQISPEMIEIAVADKAHSKGSILHGDQFARILVSAEQARGFYHPPATESKKGEIFTLTADVAEGQAIEDHMLIGAEDPRFQQTALRPGYISMPVKISAEIKDFAMGERVDVFLHPRQSSNAPSVQKATEILHQVRILGIEAANIILEIPESHGELVIGVMTEGRLAITHASGESDHPIQPDPGLLLAALNARPVVGKDEGGRLKRALIIHRGASASIIPVGSDAAGAQPILKRKAAGGRADVN